MLLIAIISISLPLLISLVSSALSIFRNHDPASGTSAASIRTNFKSEIFNFKICTSGASTAAHCKWYRINGNWYFLYLLLLSSAAFSQSPTTWSATDGLGRTLPLHDGAGDLRSDRTVGIFYFLWLGAHGYDAHTSPLADEGVMPVLDTVVYASPYDITRILEENAAMPAWGPDKAFHHWGESQFGYYLSDDEWVIAKHAQLLSDADVDVVVFDVTNAVLYLPQALRVCTVFTRLKHLGWDVPRVAFLTNSRSEETTERLYRDFYAKNYYPDLWFQWKGKPLLMGNPEGLSDEILDFFTIRRSWAWTEGQEWFADGKDKWPWLDHSPQQYGWHDDPGTPEQIAVSTAEHPVSNIGRSFHDGHQPPPDSIDSGVGSFFAEQWQRALEVDPEFVFVTGWNEWVAMRFTDGKAKQIMGEAVEPGDTYFVDQFNAEFSRDIEPMKGGFGDNYYYQLVANVRRYKGAEAPVIDTITHEISIDGTFSDWDPVRAIYYDQVGDTGPRDHPGWGGAGRYVDTSGRLDLLEARVARVPDGLAFYLRVAPSEGFRSDGVTLYLDTAPSDTTSLGYEYRVVIGGGAGAGLLQRSGGGWAWSDVGEVPVRYAADGQLEMSVPLELLGHLAETIDFKWVEGDDFHGDPDRFYRAGDCAPNARFNYVFHLNQSTTR